MVKNKLLGLSVYLLVVAAGISYFAQVGTIALAKDTGSTRDVRPALLKDIPLEWKPTDPISSYAAIDLTVYNKVDFEIRPFNDMRIRPAEIGGNFEKKLSDQGLLVTTKDNVASWLTDRFADVFSGFNISVVKANPTLILEADIVKFFVTEESRYRGEVALKVRLKNPAGKIIWEGLTSGKETRFGQSYKTENYYETLSNAVVSVVHGLLKNQQFMDAVKSNK